MAEKHTFVYNNTYLRKIDKLYLDSTTADVNFIFHSDTEHCEKVPAHKNILSLDNAAFKAMFFGLAKEKGDIPIKNASIAAFKEFLQFFYLDRVHLSANNVVEVMNLCNMYGMDECMEACGNTFKKSLTIDDMCGAYNIAVMLEQKNLIEFCKQQIIANAPEIIKSETFLESDRDGLNKILDLVLSKWSALETAVACMEWAKAECSRKKIAQNPMALRHELGELLSRIPFDKLTLEQFAQHLITYMGFFDGEEINQQILIQNEQSDSFDLQLHEVNLPQINLQPGDIDCNRQIVKRWKSGPEILVAYTHSTFSSNKNLLLTKFCVPFRSGIKINYEIQTTHGENKYEGDSFNQWIVLSEPYTIEANKSYTIFASINNYDREPLKFYPLLINSFSVKPDVVIRFVPFEADFISRLIFQENNELSKNPTKKR